MASGNPSGAIGLCSVIRYLILRNAVLLRCGFRQPIRCNRVVFGDSLFDTPKRCPFDGMASGNPSGAIGLCSVIRYLTLRKRCPFDGMASGNPSGAVGLCSVIHYTPEPPERRRFAGVLADGITRSHKMVPNKTSTRKACWVTMLWQTQLYIWSKSRG